MQAFHIYDNGRYICGRERGAAQRKENRMVQKKRPLVILSGPTAVGKTALSISLAKAINGEIISADSMQVYRGMDIGTAKIRKNEMNGVPHYLLDILEPDEPFDVSLYQTKVLEVMEEIYGRGHIPILTGGTGFYIQAVLYGIDFREDVRRNEMRAELEDYLEKNGKKKLYELLQIEDPPAAQAIHGNNIKKVIRALEFKRLSGMSITEHNEQERQKPPCYNSAYFVLNLPRQVLYDRIEARIDQMVEEGLVEEVKRLHGQGIKRTMTSMAALGYKEIYAYLEGECTLEEAIEILKKDTRHFAKRQLTWFRRERDIIWIEKNEYENEEQMLKTMLQELRKREILVEQE